MFKSDNTTRLMVGKNIGRTAGVQITDTGTPATFIADGEILVLDSTDSVLAPGDTTADTPTIRIVQGRGLTKPMTSSVVIDGSQIISATSLDFRDSVEQTSFVGYNGAAGSVDAQPFTDYKLTIIFKHDKEMFSEQLLKRTYYYSTGAVAGQEEIVDAFIAAIDAEEFYGVATTKLSAGPNFGIQLDGQPLDFELPTFEWNVMMFETLLSKGFGATTLTEGVAPAVTADKGSGKGEQISEMEYFTNGFDGAINRVYFPADKGTKDALVASDYDLIAIESYDVSEDYVVSGVKPARALTLIAIEDGAAQGAAVLAQLNPWLASAVRPSGPLTL